MKKYQLPMALLITQLSLPIILFGQNPHQKIRKMEQARFEKKQSIFFSKALEIKQSEFDVKYYRIELKINPSNNTINGNVTTIATSIVDGLDQITLDFFDNMQVDSIISNSTSMDFTHSNNELIINLPNIYNVNETFSIKIFYNGRPVSAGGFASFTFRQHNSAPIISTLSEPFGAPTWWPCKDNPADKADSVDIIITVPDTLVVASNGKLISEIQNYNNTKTFHWAERYPISTYLVSLAISNYETFSDYYKYSDNDSMEVKFYAYPEDISEAREDFNVTVEMIDYFSKVFGQYPFINEKYGMAEFPWGGAMEHQTCTSYGAGLIRGDHWYDYINAHELAHQWFGDLITMKSWSHIWLNEGFASYAEALWTENIGGKEAYLKYMQTFDQGVFPTSVFVYDSTSIGALFSRTVYDKGAYLLHMLRHVMGDSSFFNALLNYRYIFAFANASTEDFREICEDEYGENLDWFFDQWVYGRYRPSYEYIWKDSTAGNDFITTLRLSQVQTNTGIFKMPLDIKLTTASGETTIVVWDSLASQTFQFFLSEKATNLTIDPEGWVLKELLYTEEFLIKGSVIKADGSTPIEGAVIYFGWFDDNYNNVFIDSVFTDDKGFFATPVISGTWGLVAMKNGYLPTETRYVKITSPVTSLQFILNAPKISTNPDSFFIFLNENEIYSDTLRITNSGSGALIYSIAPTLSNFTPSKISGAINLSPVLKIPHLRFQGFESVMQKTTIAGPADSLWQLVYADPIDNNKGVIDLNETWLQVYNNQLFLKVTAFHTYEDPTDFQYFLMIDSDGNRNTGLPTPYLGGDHLIAVSDYGTVYGVLFTYRNGGFEAIGFASYQDVAPNRKDFTVGFPINLIKPGEIMAMFSFVQNISDPLFDQDYAPNDNQGYFVYGTAPLRWFNIETNFDVVNSSETSMIPFSINPEGQNSGRHEFNLFIFNNQPEFEPKVIPITFDYITKVKQNYSIPPKDFSVTQNYPNPFNSETQIQYDLPKQGNLTLDIYNMLGQQIRQLVNKIHAAGSYSIEWDGSDNSGKFVGSGIYFYVIKLNNQALPARKMVILK